MNYPKYYAEYLNDFMDYEDCRISFVSLSTRKMARDPIPTFQGIINADMAAELLDKSSIPYYLKMDWLSLALDIGATSLPNQLVQIYVCHKYRKRTTQLKSTISNKKI